MKKPVFPQIAWRKWVLILLIAILPLAIMMLERNVPKRKMASAENASSSPGPMADHDLSEVPPEDFKKAFKYQVLRNISIENSAVGPGIRLGLFFMKNSSGNRVFVCDQYPTIDLIFAAEGIAISGEIPQMIVRGPCIASADQKHIEALPIPFSQIVKSPTAQFEFRVELPGSHEHASIYFRNVVEFWPTEWTWVGVNFYGQNTEDTLKINGYELISVLGEPLVLKASPSE